jgi:carboxypeptidase Q
MEGADMRRRTLGSALLLLVMVAPAAGQEAVDRGTVERIRAEGLERSQALALYTHLLDAIGPRLAGTPSYRASAAWAAERFETWGLGDVHLEPFEFGRGWTLEKLTLEMTAPRYFPLTGYPEAWSPSTAGMLSGAPVYIGDKTEAEIRALGDALRGAIVLPVPAQAELITEDRPQPADTDGRVRIGAPPMLRSQGEVPNRALSQLLEEMGAGVLLRPNQGQHGTLFVLGSRNTSDDAVPSVILAAEHYNMLVRMVASGAPVRVAVEVRARYEDNGGTDDNVIAEIAGTDLAEEVVLIGAHLDSWHSSPGSTDNADGVTAVMEAARILAALDARPRRTIRFALWGAEEQGLIGSRAYAAQHYDGEANAAAREKLYVYFNDDPGTGATYGFYLEENAAVKPIFDAWLAPLADLDGRRNVIDRIGSTDHLAFTRLGLPAFNTLKDYVDYDVRTHHTNMDFHERISERDLQQSAIVLAVFAWQAANRAQPLPEGPPPPER